jgi:hypothetical protein
MRRNGFFPANGPVIHKVDLIGDDETTIYDVARRLLAEGAGPRDEVQTYREGVISMAGKIGWLAKWRVVFRPGGPCLERYAGPTLAGVAGKTGVQAIRVAEGGAEGSQPPEIAIVGGNGQITRSMPE